VTALYEDYLEMIDREKPDLVAICTRGEHHASMAVQVARAGVKMIFCEKAIACSMKEADAVLEACRDVAFNTGVLRRFDTRYHAARQVIARGDIGQPKVAVHYASTNLLHGHIHSVDTLMYLLGDPQVESVWGELRPRGTKIEHNRIDQDPNAVYHIAFAGGLEAWTVPAGHWDFEVIGTEGAVRGMNNGADWELRKAQPAGRRAYLLPAAYQPPAPFSATVYLLEDIVKAFEEGRPTLGNAEVTHRATEVCLAVAESHRQGNVRLSLPIADRDLYVYHV
jgi:predicted dehydrogenase